MPDSNSFCHSEFEGWVGVGRQDITPPTDIYARNWGAANKDLAEGIHRPFTLTSLVLKENPEGTTFVLIAMDGSWWKTHEDEWLVRGGLLEALSLDPAQVIVNLSHTHAGPSLCRLDTDKPGGNPNAWGNRRESGCMSGSRASRALKEKT